MWGLRLGRGVGSWAPWLGGHRFLAADWRGDPPLESQWVQPSWWGGRGPTGRPRAARAQAGRAGWGLSPDPLSTLTHLGIGHPPSQNYSTTRRAP